jgi:hypothetical protein
MMKGIATGLTFRSLSFEVLRNSLREDLLRRCHE